MCFLDSKKFMLHDVSYIHMCTDLYVFPLRAHLHHVQLDAMSFHLWLFSLTPHLLALNGAVEGDTHLNSLSVSIYAYLQV
jgi:hypothetical protein